MQMMTLQEWIANLTQWVQGSPRHALSGKRTRAELSRILEAEGNKRSREKFRSTSLLTRKKPYKLKVIAILTEHIYKFWGFGVLGLLKFTLKLLQS